MSIDHSGNCTKLPRMNAPSNLIRCTPEHVRYLAQRMRPDEIEQFLAYTGEPEYDAEAVVRCAQDFNGPKFTLLDRHGLPAVSGGYFCVAPGVWQSWMVGSMAGWESSWRSITKASRWLIASLFACGARRVQTYVIASRTRACQWYARGLGMWRERTLRAEASNGEDVHLYVRGA